MKFSGGARTYAPGSERLLAEAKFVFSRPDSGYEVEDCTTMAAVQ